MIVHLVDGTYELFRHFYGLRRFSKGKDRPFGAVIGVLQTMLQMIEQGATNIGVATDHIIESFRNQLWPGYKTSEGIEGQLQKAVVVCPRGEHHFAIIARLNRVERLTLRKKRGRRVLANIDLR